MGRYHLGQALIFFVYFGVLSYVLYQSSIFLTATGSFLQSLANQRQEFQQNRTIAEILQDSTSLFRPSIARTNRRMMRKDSQQRFEGNLSLPTDFSAPLKGWQRNNVIENNGSHERSKRGSPDLFVILKSRPQEFFQRDAVRRTWGAEFRGRLTFLIGRASSPDLSAQLHSAIRLEWEKFGDILYVDFVDTYYNLSLKFLASLNYMTSFSDCGASFYLYGDTDALVYPDNAKEFVRKRLGKERTIYGLCWKDARVFRDGKWKMPQGQYISTYYPHYCAGGSFFMTGDVPGRLLRALNLRHPYFQIDDVFFTGIIAERAMVKRVKTPGIYMLSDLNRMKDCECLRLLATFEYQGAEALRGAWHKFLKETKECPS